MNQRDLHGIRCPLATIATTLLLVSAFIAPAGARGAEADATAQKILEISGVRGGLVVHLGCEEGALVAALGAREGFLAHGLTRDARKVRAAREALKGRGLYGRVSVDRLEGERLPYIDGLVNLIVISRPEEFSRGEMLRVLCPGGVACIRENGDWVRVVKPRPEEIDDWTHYLHDSSNNAVAHDTVVGPPDRLQWVGSPRFARHHDRMSSFSAAVTAGGRVFYIFDEGSPVSILLPPAWKLIARDAFNGTVLWKRSIEKWHTHLWPLKSGPAQLPRRLVASGDRVYVTLGIDAPLTQLDATTGETLRTYDETRATEEVLFIDGMLLALVDETPPEPEYANLEKIRPAYGAKFWDERPRKIVALRAETGEVLWTVEKIVLPVTLAASGERVFFHDGESVVCLARDTGKELWRSEPVARTGILKSFYAPILVVYEDVVLFSGGETAGAQTGSWYTSGKDTMTALSVETGKTLWQAYHPPSGYRSPEDLLVVDGLVWTGETTSGRVAGVFTGRDPRTGEVKKEFPPDVSVYWFHHRCYRGKATSNYLLMSRAGTEFIDVEEEKWTVHHWFRGACLYGVLPANGLVYAPQSPCACYLESKLYGFNALAPSRPGPRCPEGRAAAGRLEKGPAFGDDVPASPATGDWPTYRRDAARSGRAPASGPLQLADVWETEVGGRLSSPVVAEGRVLVASVDAHTVHSLDQASGNRVWSYTAGGRVDSPPTVDSGRVIFGSRDGHVYCLRATDGALIWRFRAAPVDERLVAFEQLESVWPVHGSVLLEDGAVYFASGRSMFLDGGLTLWRLDPATGEVLSQTPLTEEETATGKELHEFVSWLNMPPAMPDILSSDGRLVYMKSQPFHLDGTRLPLEPPPRGGDADAGAPEPVQDPRHSHVFCPTGLLDDSWWHRTYWMYGSMFVSGWCGYYRAGQAAPAGRILVFDDSIGDSIGDSTVYGFGRKPQYYRWTTPIEHHLFAAAMDPAKPDGTAGAGPEETIVRVGKAKSLDPSGMPLTVSAWVRAEQPSGVILARGGGSHGYVLYLEGGRPGFAVRRDQKLFKAVAKEKIQGRWAHLAGVLARDGEIRIHVDGKPVASAKAAGLLTADPQEALQIGADEGSTVGDYAGPAPFKGAIDEVRVVHRALKSAEIRKLAGAEDGTPAPDAMLVLRYSFDDGSAADASGKGNAGQVVGASPVEGRVGRALAFSGRVRRTDSKFQVRHRWTTDLPMLPRAMVLAGERLFVAGPPDLLDEPGIFARIDSPDVMATLRAQEAALAGRKGAVLLAVSAEKGEVLSRRDLANPPVFDGMAAARGKLYIATTDGRVLCVGKGE